MSKNDGAPYPLPAWQQHLAIAALAIMCGVWAAALIYVVILGGCAMRAVIALVLLALLFVAARSFHLWVIYGGG